MIQFRKVYNVILKTLQYMYSMKFLFNPLDEKIDIFLNSSEISSKKFKKLIYSYLLDTYSELVLYGSIVYDFENAEDIDICGKEFDLEKFKNNLNKHFDIEDITLKNTNHKTNHITSDGYNCYNNKLVQTINVSYKNIFLTKIDLVNSDYLVNMYPQDFVETSMI